jgi:hypothetical protein
MGSSESAVLRRSESTVLGSSQRSCGKFSAQFCEVLRAQLREGVRVQFSSGQGWTQPASTCEMRVSAEHTCINYAILCDVINASAHKGLPMDKEVQC